MLLFKNERKNRRLPIRAEPISYSLITVLSVCFFKNVIEQLISFSLYIIDRVYLELLYNYSKSLRSTYIEYINLYCTS